MKKGLLIWLLAVIGAIHVTAQTRNITGKVTDGKDNSPLPGVTVVIKGSNKGVLTKGDGTYTVSAQEGETLVYSFIGYISKQAPVTGNSVINISLDADNKQLGEIVVTAIGIKRTEASLGYSVSQIKPDQITQKSEPDILKGLQGKVAGVDIRAGQGTPGGATKINIRGFTSFFGSNEPLIVVDGIPYNNDQVTTSSQTSGGGAYSSGLSSLDPNDIASISVLKGAAAAALYGSRASNGALIVTTKSGSASISKRKTEVTYSSSVSIENIASLPDYQNLYGAGNKFNYANSNGSWGPKFGSRDSIPAWPDYLAAFPDLFPVSGNIKYQAQPNNVKDLFRTGTVIENSVSANGGTDKSAISATASYLNQDGYVPNSSFNRGSMSVGGTTKLDNGLQVGANFSYSRSNQLGSVFGENQVDGAASSFARTLFLARNWDLNLPYEDANGKPVSPLTAQFDNPRWAWKHNTVSTNTDRYIAGLKLSYNILPWINVSYQLGTNTNSFFRREITDIGSRAAEGKGRIIEQNYQFQEIESNLLATFTPKIGGGDKFHFRGILGHNVNQRSERIQTMTGNEIVNAGIYNITNTKSVLGVSEFYRHRLYGVFANLELDYKNYLFLTLTGRNDKSSTLPKDNNSYFYPSASAAFVFTEALGIGGNVLNFGKVRTSWAKVGRDADPYSLTNTFNINTAFLGQAGAIQTPTAANPLLKPEFTQDFEIGTVLEFLDRRITFDGAVYQRTSTNQIATLPIPASSGFTRVYDNFGKITNKGIELDLGLTPVRTKDFTWTLHGIFTKNKSKVVSLTKGVDRIELSGILSDISPYLEAGKPYGYLRGSVNARDSKGNLLINPTTGLLIRSTEQQMVGDPNPDFKAGINTTLTYKGFFLNALFDMTKGGDIYSVTVSSLLGRGVTLDTKDREGGFVIPGVYGDANTGKPLVDAKGAEIPNHTIISKNEMFFGESFAINAATEWNVYDATLYTFREATLGYTFPKEMFTKTPIGGLTITFTGRNLWYLAPNMPKYTNFNPEAGSFGNTNVQGIELSGAPTTRRFGVNLKVSF
ncbi:SusC/RagA family TonB-linked outer membrane protein [Chitinophaga oryziterrae]|uniref:SusC/RagA family TonB-linked outer membrane protein n=1 Tax=Chitinophaga oryziterrae TaxID=1031224 RepID=A0A6N8JEB9_9BACT|nr:SusC/RagA family TonB-linked outer membrane protein [Chitinophaga oryziterrae]MVT42688.1 SusC/RagA family TonB-linked outer membrane protein [Chitinophaga oryziterrae]